jgi:hypothetical protein
MRNKKDIKARCGTRRAILPGTVHSLARVWLPAEQGCSKRPRDKEDNKSSAEGTGLLPETGGSFGGLENGGSHRRFRAEFDSELPEIWVDEPVNGSRIRDRDQ